MIKKKFIIIPATLAAFALAACGATSNNATPTNSPNSSSASSTSNVPSSSSAEAATSGAASNNASSTSDEAGEVAGAIAAIEAAETANPGFTAHEIDWDDNHWEVSLVGADKTDIDVHVDANGSILSTETDNDLIDADEEALLAESTVSLTDALRNSGASKVDDADLTRSGGTLVWKIDEVDDVTVILVDATTGTVLA